MTSIDSNILRFSGLASGMDIDSIVQKLMAAESIPLDKMKQQQQTLEWQRDDYRSMNSLLLDLKNTTFNMSLQGTYLAKTATSSNESIVTATSGATAGNSTYTIQSVTSLATAAYNTSVSSVTTTGFDPSKSLVDMQSYFTNGIQWTQNTVSTEAVTNTSGGTSFQLAHGAIDTTTAPTIYIDGTAIPATQTFTDQASYDAAVAADSTKQYALIDPSTGKLTLNQSITSTQKITADYSYKTVDFTLTTYDTSGNANPQTFSIDGSKSLNDALSQINSNTTLGVNAYYDTQTGKVSFTRTQTGNLNTSGDEMQFSGSFLTTTLDLHNGTDVNGVNYEQGGTDASFTLNGLATTRHSNTFTVNGTTFTLKGTTSTAVNINITSDVDTVFNSIKAFVDKYNDTIKKINDKISEKRYRDYQPLTDAQKKDMKDTDIELWNEKAMSGMLSNDDILPSTLSKMRVDLYTPISGLSDPSMSQLAEIGITTSPLYTDNGKLVIDETKLRQAISDNPNGVMELFAGKTDPNTNTTIKGIADLLDDTIDNTMDRIEDKAGNASSVNNNFFIGRQLDDMTTKIDDYQTYLNGLQNRYYKEFTAMEQAVQQSNQQAAYLSSNFG